MISTHSKFNFWPKNLKHALRLVSDRYYFNFLSYQIKIKHQSLYSRANALAAAQLYADDIQNLLEIDIQNRIHSTP